MRYLDITAIVVPASVPGGIYSDLAKNGSIFSTEIYFRYNDVETKWVGHTNWTFARAFIGKEYGTALVRK